MKDSQRKAMWAKLKTARTEVKDPILKKQIEFKTDKPVSFSYLHNTQKAEYFGSRYGQNIEPHGVYVTRDEMGWEPQQGYEKGIMHLNKPLVIHFEDTNQWKQSLVNATGKKSRALTNDLLKKGYDGIVTVDKKGNTWEIVKLKSKQT